MKNLKIKPILLILSFALLVSCGSEELKINTSSEKSYEESIKKIEKAMNEEEKKKFQDSMLVINMNDLIKGGIKKNENTKDFLKLLSALNGLTAKEVIEKAKKLNKSNSLENNFANAMQKTMQEAFKGFGTSEEKEESDQEVKIDPKDIIEYDNEFIAPLIKIKITKVYIDNVNLKGEESPTKEKYLHIKLKFTNNSERKILRLKNMKKYLEYKNFKLKDDFGNKIKPISIYDPIVGELGNGDEIYPEKVMNHIIAFKVPPVKTKFLIISIDLKAFAAKGKAHLKIPSEKIEGFQK